MPPGQKTKAQNRSNVVTNKDFKNGPHKKKKEKESLKKKNIKRTFHKAALLLLWGNSVVYLSTKVECWEEWSPRPVCSLNVAHEL